MRVVGKRKRNSGAQLPSITCAQLDIWGAIELCGLISQGVLLCYFILFFAFKTVLLIFVLKANKIFFVKFTFQCRKRTDEQNGDKSWTKSAKFPLRKSYLKKRDVDSYAGFAGYVSTEAVSREKKLWIPKQTDTCARRLNFQEKTSPSTCMYGTCTHCVPNSSHSNPRVLLAVYNRERSNIFCCLGDKLFTIKTVSMAQ